MALDRARMVETVLSVLNKRVKYRSKERLRPLAVEIVDCLHGEGDP